MPVFENDPEYSLSAAEVFTVDYMKWWVPILIGVLILLFLVYKYYYKNSTDSLKIKRY